MSLKEITTFEEFSPAMDCLWDSNHSPYDPLINIEFPVSANTQAGYDSAVADSKTRTWAAHIQNPASSFWVCVVNDTGDVLAAAHWEIYRESPYTNGSKVEVDWQPEGDGREFASRVMNGIYHFRGKRLLRPHAQLGSMITYPKERRKGYASMLMKWGMNKAREMGVEEFVVESTELGHHLYHKFGLRTVDIIVVDTMIENPSNTWKRLQSDLGCMQLWWMWKPRDGVYEEGKTLLPWCS